MALQPASRAARTRNVPPGLSDVVKSRIAKAPAALKFVLMVGVMSFFADFTYEGSRSIIGPYLATLQASGAIVGIVSGVGELLGYGSGWYPAGGRMPRVNTGRLRYLATLCRWGQCPHWH